MTRNLDDLCIFSDVEKDWLEQSFCQHCECPMCRETGQCEKCGERTR